MTLYRELTNDGHIHRFIVTSTPVGWEVLEETDSDVLHRVHRGDWHRVERDVLLFEVKALSLKRTGWTEHECVGAY
jgi:hypothetical protein